MSNKTVITDGCPAWAVDLILTLRDLEIQLGNVMPDPKEKGDEYVSRSLAGLVQGNLEVDDAATEVLFAKIAQKLSESGFVEEQIASFINVRVAPGAKLPYCDVSEVCLALSGS